MFFKEHLLFAAFRGLSTFRVLKTILMKTLLSFVALTFFVLTSSFTIDAQKTLNTQQSSDCFTHFRAHRQGRDISLTWGANPQGIMQFVVERSYDNDFFEPAGWVDNHGATNFRYKDVSVFAGTIYYRITALKSDGTTATSQVERVRIVQRG